VPSSASPSARPLLGASLAGLAATFLVGVVPALPLPASWATLDWSAAHTALALFSFLFPALAFLTWHVAGPLLPRPLRRTVGVARLWLAGAILLAIGQLLGPRGGHSDLVAFAGGLVLAAAGILQTMAVLPALPKRSESVVDVKRDPLTKGDDASLKHVRFAHMVFLPMPLLAYAASFAPGIAGLGWNAGLRIAALHWLLAGHALLMTYGLCHLAIPRLSGVPAIAAGAITGELHSSLLGLLLLAIGFLGGGTGWLIGGGALVFLGAFVFMGVLGANVMKNKSPTQRVTPEFAYIPWTFAGVFWLIAGVLLGLFMNAVLAKYPDFVAPMRFVHGHAALLGGFAQLVMGLATRLVPAARGDGPAPFHRTRWSFLGLNLAVVLLIVGRLEGGVQGTTFLVGSLLALAALAGWFKSLLPPATARGGRA